MPTPRVVKSGSRTALFCVKVDTEVNNRFSDSSCWNIIIKQIHTFTMIMLFQRRRFGLGCLCQVKGWDNPDRNIVVETTWCWWTCVPVLLDNNRLLAVIAKKPRQRGKGTQSLFMFVQEDSYLTVWLKKYKKREKGVGEGKKCTVVLHSLAWLGLTHAQKIK